MIAVVIIETANHYDIKDVSGVLLNRKYLSKAGGYHWPFDREFFLEAIENVRFRYLCQEAEPHGYD